MLKKTALSGAILILMVLSFTKLASNYYWDITQNKINTLTRESAALVSSLEEPLVIQVYSPNIEILNSAAAILAPYKKESRLVSIELHEGLINPELVSTLKISSDHNVVVSYKQHQRSLAINLTDFNEQQMSTLIQRVVNNTSHWLVFLTGHQEAETTDASPLGLSNFASLCAEQGMHIAHLNLAQQQSIPDNTSTLIIVNPQHDLLALEKSLIHRYLAHGGNLLWFTEPDSNVKSFIQEEFGIKLSKGVVIDPQSTKLGSPHPALKIILNHNENPITKDLKTAILLPWSGDLDISRRTNNWQPEVFLSTNEHTWTYAGQSTQDLDLMAKNKEKAGPLNIGVALTRTINSKQQRSMVIADSTFISNKYIALYANSQLANNIVSWVPNDPQHFAFSPTPARDLHYQPGNFDIFLFRYGFTIILPLLLIGVGLLAERRI